MLAKLQNTLKLQWGFMDADLESPEDQSTPGPSCLGLTTINGDYMMSSNDPDRFWRIFIWLVIDMLNPLVRRNPSLAYNLFGCFLFFECRQVTKIRLALFMDLILIYR